MKIYILLLSFPFDESLIFNNKKNAIKYIQNNNINFRNYKDKYNEGDILEPFSNYNGYNATLIEHSISNNIDYVYIFRHVECLYNRYTSSYYIYSYEPFELVADMLYEYYCTCIDIDIDNCICKKEFPENIKNGIGYENIEYVKIKIN
jgi:hypothetical protein